MTPSLQDPSTIVAIWSLVAIAGVGVAALPWSSLEVHRSATAWRPLGGLLGRHAIRWLAYARSLATTPAMPTQPHLAPATIRPARRRLAM